MIPSCIDREADTMSGCAMGNTGNCLLGCHGRFLLRSWVTIARNYYSSTDVSIQEQSFLVKGVERFVAN
jgi:hypothetical protein